MGGRAPDMAWMLAPQILSRAWPAPTWRHRRLQGVGGGRPPTWRASKVGGGHASDMARLQGGRGGGSGLPRKARRVDLRDCSSASAPVSAPRAAVSREIVGNDFTTSAASAQGCAEAVANGTGTAADARVLQSDAHAPIDRAKAQTQPENQPTPGRLRSGFAYIAMRYGRSASGEASSRARNAASTPSAIGA